MIADRNLCLGDLIGVIKTFFHKIGITQVSGAGRASVEKGQGTIFARSFRETGGACADLLGGRTAVHRAVDPTFAHEQRQQ